MVYNVFSPSNELQSIVKQYVVISSSDGIESLLFLPNGCNFIVFNRGVDGYTKIYNEDEKFPVPKNYSVSVKSNKVRKFVLSEESSSENITFPIILAELTPIGFYKLFNKEASLLNRGYLELENSMVEQYFKDLYTHNSLEEELEYLNSSLSALHASQNNTHMLIEDVIDKIVNSYHFEVTIDSLVKEFECSRSTMERNFKIITILLITLILLSAVRVLLFHFDSINTTLIYIIAAKELFFSILSATFILIILYVFIKKEIQVVNTKALNYAFTDGLTGLYNRHYLNDFLEKFTPLHKEEASYAVLFIDIDKFKQVNDTLGHVTGDCILKILALKLKSLTRSSDILCRYGGEEFIIIFSDISKESAMAKAEQMRVDIQDMIFDCKQQSITASIGLSFGGRDDDINQVIEEADQALYMAKESGRNCVKVSTLK
ncbi:MAG: GGDEF domain-containing protein [Campylobacterota bacterium]|nr:GGDEF domain-containing protein [Campylobacterota bacterium]